MKTCLLLVLVALTTSCATSRLASEGSTSPSSVALERCELSPTMTHDLLLAVLGGSDASTLFTQRPEAQLYVCGLALRGEEQIEFAGRFVSMHETSRDEMNVLMKFTPCVGIQFGGEPQRPSWAEVTATFLTASMYRKLDLMLDGARWNIRVVAQGMTL